MKRRGTEKEGIRECSKIEKGRKEVRKRDTERKREREKERERERDCKRRWDQAPWQAPSTSAQTLKKKTKNLSTTF